MSKKTIAIVGPKGGIGKSTISSNLAIALAEMGKKVTALDLDLGGANLHVLLGIKNVPHSLDDFLLKKVEDLKDILIDTELRNLKVICGGTNIPDIANMPFMQKMKLINHISRLDSDIAILDLAAGSSFNVIDFLFIANQQIIITSPESPSLIKVYGFLKSCVFRMLSFHLKNERAEEALEVLTRAKDTDANPHLKTINGIIGEIEGINPAAAESSKKMLTDFRPNIVLNMVRSEDETKAGKVICSMLKQYLSIEAKVIASVPSDEMVRRALFKNRPMMLIYPGSPFCLAIKGLAERCIYN
jgi:flagellar biosynthesis protein FlhG